MKLNITRPICFFDIESTGLDVAQDRIIELSICKLNPTGEREVKTKRFNPGIPIPENATQIHGITDQDVIDCPTFKSFAKGILTFISNCDLGGFNCNAYDIPLLFNEFERAGLEMHYMDTKFIDAFNIFKIKEQRTLSAAVSFYTGKNHEGAHGAEADVLATVEIFLAQMERYEDLPHDMAELHLYCNYNRPVVDISRKFSVNDQGEIIFNFGMHKGHIARDNPSYLKWMLNAEFAKDTCKIAIQLLEGLKE